ncbi:MAG TPA: hypothetical protein VJB15_02110 [Rhodothermia bacterium]|nr:hypothetical protein [Rhodothermia bacterium]
MSRYGQFGSPQRLEHAALIFGGRRPRMFRLALLACSPRALDHAFNPKVAPLKEIMASDSLSATDRHEG